MQKHRGTRPVGGVVLSSELRTLTSGHSDRVWTLQITFVRHSQLESVLSHLKACYRGNRAICILYLHTIWTPALSMKPQIQALLLYHMNTRVYFWNVIVYMNAKIIGHWLCFFPVVLDYFLVVTALAAIEGGVIHRKRQLLVWPCICYWWLVIL